MADTTRTSDILRFEPPGKPGFLGKVYWQVLTWAVMMGVLLFCAVSGAVSEKQK